MIFMKISVIGDYYLRKLSLYLDICHNRSDLVGLFRSEVRPGCKILDRMRNKTRTTRSLSYLAFQISKVGVLFNRLKCVKEAFR